MIYFNYSNIFFGLLLILNFETIKLSEAIKRASIFPTKKLKINGRKQLQLLASKSHFPVKTDNIKFNFLHNERHYNSKYLLEYTKMISSLLSSTELSDKFINLMDLNFLPTKFEVKTVNSLYNESIKKLPDCKENKEKNWRKLKVFQVEESNSVYLKEHKNSRVKVVEKRMDNPKNYEKELNFFSHSQHNSLKYFPSLVCHSISKTAKGSKKQIYKIVTEFVEGEKSHIMAARATTDQIRHMVAQLFNSIIELHKTGYIHCDLSPANVIVSNAFNTKLIDFGMAMRVGKANGYRGSTYTRAPELHEKVPGKIDVGIDWWAFGCTVSIWYFYNFNPQSISQSSESVDSDDPIYQFTPMKLRKKTNTFFAMKFPDELSTPLRKFLFMFLVIDPELRTFSTERLQNLVRQHEFFEGFDWSNA